MARFSKDSEFKYTIKDNFDFVVDEKNNSFIALRKIIWGEDTDDPSKVKLDLRRWISTPDGEQCGKGVSFLTENGPNELVHVLVEQGYGDTSKIMNLVSQRDNFFDTIKGYLGETLTEEQAELFKSERDNISYDDGEELYDPREDLFDEDDFDLAG